MSKERMKTGSIQLPPKMWEYFAILAQEKNKSVSTLIRGYLSSMLRYNILTLLKSIKQASDITKLPVGILQHLISYVAIIENKCDPKTFTAYDLMLLLKNDSELFDRAMGYLVYTLDKSNDTDIIDNWLLPESATEEAE